MGKRILIAITAITISSPILSVGLNGKCEQTKTGFFCAKGDTLCQKKSCDDKLLCVKGKCLWDDGKSCKTSKECASGKCEKNKCCANKPNSYCDKNTKCCGGMDCIKNTCKAKLGKQCKTDLEDLNNPGACKQYSKGGKVYCAKVNGKKGKRCCRASQGQCSKSSQCCSSAPYCYKRFGKKDVKRCYSIKPLKL